MNRDSIIKAMMDWNFWYREQFTGVSREEYVSALLRYLETGLVVNLSGVKRSGKSTIFNQAIRRLIQGGIDPLNTLLLNFEDPRLSVDGEELFQVYSLFQELRAEKGVKGKPYLFLDEVQRVRGWEGFVRSIVDRKESFVAVSGSTSELLHLNQVLSGRHVALPVYPLSFREFLTFKGVQISSELDLLARESEVKALFQEYLRYGGFPLVVLSPMKESILVNLYQDLVSKDVIEACNLRNAHQVRDLSLFYLSNVGNRVTLRRVSRLLNIPFKNALRYTECLRRAFLVFLVSPLTPKLSEMVRGEKKVYSVDHGLANVVGFRLGESLGSLLENLVFLELLRRHGEGIYYFRGKRGEVDFVVKGKVIEAYQVTYSLEAQEREVKGMEELLERGEVRAKIITFDEEGEVEVKGRRVPVVRAWKWLLGR